MSRKTPRSHNHPVILRFIVLIASTLLLIGVGFDAFLNAQSTNVINQQFSDLMEGDFELIEAELENIAPDLWPQVIDQYREILSTPISMISIDAVKKLHPGIELHGGYNVLTLYTSSGELIFSKRLLLSDYMLLLGPFPVEQSANDSYQLLPLMFYFSIFFVVWLWLRPMIKDLDLLNNTASELSKNYTASVDSLRSSTTLPQVSQAFINMAEQLKRLINTQKELSNALSHELRTPLSRIKFGLAIVESNLPEKQQQEVKHIHQDLHEMEAIIDSLLEYARLDSPDLVIERQRVPAEAWLLEQVNKYKAANPEKQIAVSNEIGTAPLLIDPYLMGLALSNLVNNAIKYSQGCIEVKLVEVDQQIHLTVEDDGAGIPQNQQSKVFKAFYRLDQSRDKRTGGHGLGLSIVKRIVELHMGQASLGSSALGGACFTLSWPIAERA